MGNSRFLLGAEFCIALILGCDEIESVLVAARKMLQNAGLPLHVADGGSSWKQKSVAKGRLAHELWVTQLHP